MVKKKTKTLRHAMIDGLVCGSIITGSIGRWAGCGGDMWWGLPRWVNGITIALVLLILITRWRAAGRLDRSNMCDPPNACATHGRCWTSTPVPCATCGLRDCTLVDDEGNAFCSMACAGGSIINKPYTTIRGPGRDFIWDQSKANDDD